MLNEAVEHSGEEGFKAEEYFTQHADMNIASVAVKLSVDRFQLSESLQVKETEATLRDRVMHLIGDFRLDYIDHHLKELMTQMGTTKDMTEQMKIMEEIKKLQDVRNVLAKKLGSDILI